MPRAKIYNTEEERKEANRVRSAEWRKANKELANQRSREWSSNNLHKRREAYHRRPEHYAEMSKIRTQRFRQKVKNEREELVKLREMVAALPNEATPNEATPNEAK